MRRLTPAVADNPERGWATAARVDRRRPPCGPRAVRL